MCEEQLSCLLDPFSVKTDPHAGKNFELRIKWWRALATYYLEEYKILQLKKNRLRQKFCMHKIYRRNDEKNGG